MCPTLESCLFSVARAAKTDMKWPLRSTDAEGGGKVYICNTMLVTQASVIIKSANIIKILHPWKCSLRIIRAHTVLREIAILFQSIDLLIDQSINQWWACTTHAVHLPCLLHLTSKIGCNNLLKAHESFLCLAAAAWLVPFNYWHLVGQGGKEGNCITWRRQKASIRAPWCPCTTLYVWICSIAAAIPLSNCAHWSQVF